MNVSESIQARRSIKAFDTSVVIPPSDFKRLIELTLLTPSSFNIQHWRFVHVTDKSKREQIRAVAWNQAQITDASDLVLVCADTKAWANNPAQYWEGAPPEVVDYMVNAIPSFYKENPVAQRDEAIRSVGMAAQTLMLAAQSMGYDSGPMIGFDPSAVAKIINLPDDYIIGMAIVLGKKLSEPRPRVGKLSVNQVLFENSF
jgi:nitroreductase